jgi:hypothetical protein
MVSSATAASAASALPPHGRSGRWELAGLYDGFGCCVAGGLNARPEARSRYRRRQKLSPAEKVWPFFFLPPPLHYSPALSQACLIWHSSAAPGYSCARHPVHLIAFDFASEALHEIDAFFRREHRVIVPLTVREIVERDDRSEVGLSQAGGDHRTWRFRSESEVKISIPTS